jgi:hypothetical protein
LEWLYPKNPGHQRCLQTWDLKKIDVGGARFLPVIFCVPDKRTTWRVSDLAAHYLLMLKHGLEVLELGVVLHLLEDVVVLVEKRVFVVPADVKNICVEVEIGTKMTRLGYL